MSTYHRILLRQLRKVGIVEISQSPSDKAWLAFLEMVNGAYRDADNDRYTLERSLSILSDETQALYEQQAIQNRSDLNRERDRLISVISSMSEGLCWLDAEGNCILVNAQATAMLGYEEADLVGKRVLDLFNSAPTLKAMGSANLMKDLLALRGGRAYRDDRAYFLDKHGKEVPVAFTLSPIGAAPAVTGAVLVFEEVSARIEAEQALQRANDELEYRVAVRTYELQSTHAELMAASTRMVSIVENLPGGNLVEDENGRVIHINHRLCEMCGIQEPPERLVGSEIWDIADRMGSVFSTDVGEFRAELKRVAQARQPVSSTQLRGRDKKFFERDYFPVFINGEFRGSLWQYRDVTERRQLEVQVAQAERMSSIGLLAAGVAHEINNPLAAAMAQLELLMADEGQAPFSAESKQRLEVIQEGLERVRNIVRDLKLFSRSDAEFVNEGVDIDACVMRAIRIADHQIRPRARLHLELGAPPPILGNSSRLGQVFVNLLANAGQAIPEGKAQENEVTVRTCAEPGGSVCVEVQDTGEGMSPETLRRLFDPFFTTKSVGQGSGLGLSISRNIVELHGGEIRVASELGKGSTFRVILPSLAKKMATAPPLERPVELSQSPVSTPTQQGNQRMLRILVVDDEESVVAVLREVLAAGGHEVVTAHSGRSGFERLKVQPLGFDLILTDLLMGDETGAELYERACGLASELKDRFVFMTGGAFTDASRAFLESQPAGRVLEKPFSLKAVRALVASFATPTGPNAAQKKVAS